MDPLSDVFSLVKIRNQWSGEFAWGRDWCLAFGPYEGIRIYAVLLGECWLSVDGVSEPVHGKTGDCLLLPSGRPFRVGSDLALPSINADALPPETERDMDAIDHEEVALRGIGGHFTFDRDHAGFLTRALPAILHIRKESDKAVLRWTLDRLGQELRDAQPGGTVVTQQLATMLLVQALRVYLAEGADARVGWLFALADKQMRAAITAMHDDPAHRWTVQSLSKRAGMSRTSFALKFKATVGTAPLEYLTEWRMRLAGDRLTKSTDSIAMIAASLSYESESAFSTAFKRRMGCSPREYGRIRNRVLESQSDSELKEAGHVEA